MQKWCLWLGYAERKNVWEQYATKLNLSNFKLGNVGLIINPKWPWLGVSPEALVDSDIIQVAEMKCPSIKRYLTIISARGNKNFCLELLQWSTKIETSSSLFLSVSGYCSNNWDTKIRFCGVYINRHAHRDNFVWARKVELGNFAKIKLFLWLYEGKHNKGFNMTTYFQNQILFSSKQFCDLD